MPNSFTAAMPSLEKVTLIGKSEHQFIMMLVSLNYGIKVDDLKKHPLNPQGDHMLSYAIKTTILLMKETGSSELNIATRLGFKTRSAVSQHVRNARILMNTKAAFRICFQTIKSLLSQTCL